MILGSAVDTTVLLSRATNSTRSSPPSASSVCRWFIGTAAAGGCAVVAAVDLVAAHGFDGVTVEAIADATMVSRRTFSNYFAGKEEALLRGDRERVRRLLELVHARPDGEAPWDALVRAAGQLVGENGAPDPDWLDHHAGEPLPAVVHRALVYAAPAGAVVPVGRGE
jgi:AcrR family transcriptional regulator